VQQGGQRPVVGDDATYVKVKGETVGLEVVVDDQTGELLGLDIITSEKSAEILALIQKTMGKVDGEVLVSDDHGAYTDVVDELGADHQLCRSHVKRNVAEGAESLTRQLEQEEETPPEESALSPDQLQQDLVHVQQLVRERPADGEEQLATLYDRHKDVPVPPPGIVSGIACGCS
jgi:hypothetical protein